MTINIPLPHSPYTVTFAPFTAVPPSAIAVTDANVHALYPHLFHEKTIVLPAGEQSKSLAALAEIYEKLVEFGALRNTPLYAVGGGVIGDITGFAAATFRRGIPFVNVPTTLLSMVDSSVGGKVAANLPAGKNLIGTFYQPSAVITDVRFLETLDKKQISSGMAEAIKHGFIDDESILEQTDYAEIIAKCVRSKARFVVNDEFDRGDRMFLNFGHTFGHAIEVYGDFSRFTHGAGVAIGMIYALKVGIKLGLTNPALLPLAEEHLRKNGLETTCDIPTDVMISHMKGDKKNMDSDINLVLLEDLGKPISYKISPSKLKETLNCLK